MIKCDKGMVDIKYSGDVPGLVTEATMVLRSVRTCLVEVVGEKITDNLLDQALRLAKMSEDEIDKEKKLLEVKSSVNFSGGGTPDNNGSVEEDKEDE